MPNNDIEQLDAIGFVWDVPEWQWQRVLKSLHVYKELHGDLEAHSDFVVHRGAVARGRVGHQTRQPCAHHPQPGVSRQGPTDRVAELNRMGFIWDVYEEQWQRILDSLHVYKELHGDLEGAL